MEIKKVKNGSEMELVIEGRLDTNSAPDLARELEGIDSDVTSLVIELEKVRYISSAGLRVILSAQKKMSGKKGTMVVRHPNDLIMEVFEDTGFISVLTIEQ